MSEPLADTAKRGGGFWLVMAVTGAFVIGLLGLGVPQLVAALHAERASEAVGQARQAATAKNGQKIRAKDRNLPPLTDARIGSAIAELNEAISWHDRREYHFGIAALESARAWAAYRATPVDAQAAYQAWLRAAKSQRRGLARAPLDPGGWTRLAWYLEWNSKPDEAIAALRKGTLVAPYAPELHWWRFELWLRLHSAFSGAEDFAMFRRQLEISYQRDPATLARLAQTYALKAYTRQLLAELPSVRVDELNRHFPR